MKVVFKIIGSSEIIKYDITESTVAEVLATKEEIEKSNGFPVEIKFEN